MISSCGALFYSYDPCNRLGIILGQERGAWLPFKGCNETGETLNQTAIREIKEETCGLVNIKSILLEHQFTSKRKHYYIGLCQVSYDIIEEFSKIRAVENRAAYCEKKKLRFFLLNGILDNKIIHDITKASIKYYWNYLNLLDAMCNTNKLVDYKVPSNTVDKVDTYMIENKDIVNTYMIENKVVMVDTVDKVENKDKVVTVDERIRKQSISTTYAKNKFTKMLKNLNLDDLEITIDNDLSSSDDSIDFYVSTRKYNKKNTYNHNSHTNRCNYDFDKLNHNWRVIA